MAELGRTVADHAVEPEQRFREIALEMAVKNVARALGGIFMDGTNFIRTEASELAAHAEQGRQARDPRSSLGRRMEQPSPQYRSATR